MISDITEITVNTGWMQMWLLSSVMFFVAKLGVTIKAKSRSRQTTLAFVTLWPGFNFAAWQRPITATMNLWLRGLTNLTLGGLLTWLIARHAPNAFIATWLCMIGFVVALHGGLFTLLTAFWRNKRRDVRPLMNAPLLAASVTDFWGRRWNLGFRDLAHTLIFKPVLRRFGRISAIIAVFLTSGVAHELVITVPARSGYGGPTIYFLLQAVGMGWERGCPLKKHGILWRIRALIFIIAPMPLLFPAAFVERVMHPFFTFIHALP